MTMNYKKRKQVCDQQLHKLKSYPYHCKLHNALTTVDWEPNEWELFQEAKQKNKIGDEYDDFETRPIIYESNDLGFRSVYSQPPNNNSNYGIAVGSSNTWGSGIHIEDRFDTLVTNEIDVPIINIGWPGASANYIKEQLLYFLLNIENKPQFIIIEWPPLTRLTFWDIGGYEIINVHATGIRQEIFEKILDLNETIYYGEAVTSFFITHSILKHFSIPVFEWSVTPDSAEAFDIDEQLIIDYARDGVHPGPKTNLEVKNKFIEFYDKCIATKK